MTKEIALVNEQGLALYKDIEMFQVLMPGQMELAQMATGNLALLPNITKMETIKVPAGGATSWELPALDGSRTAKFFDAIIIKAFMGRKFWVKPFGTDNTPPDCSSVDGVYGGYGPCSTCKYNEFVETEKGKKKLCQEYIKLVFLMDDTIVPYALTVPVKSMENFTKYLNRIAAGGRDSEGKRIPPQFPYGVVTRFALEKAKSQGNIDYAKITFQMVGALMGDQVKMMGELVKTYIPILENLMNKSGTSHDDSN